MRKMSSALRLGCSGSLGLMLLFLAACNRTDAGHVLPLPKLPSTALDFRVAYIVNERLPRMSPEQLDALLLRIQLTAQEHFGVGIRFSAITEIPIARAFEGIPKASRDVALPQIYDFKTGTGDLPRLKKAFTQVFASETGPLADRIAYAQPYTPNLRSDATVAEFGAAMADLQVQRLAQWRDMRALDSGKAVDEKPYNEFTMWLALGDGDLPFELVLTNQIIASAEYDSVSVHSAIRGGYTNGVTTYSKASRYGTTSVWSTFAFTGNDDFIVGLRGGERYEPLEAARLAGVAATHEIGHQLFHLSHPFNRLACVMNPVPMLAYRAWSNKLAAPDCRLGSDPQMTPGAYHFRY